MSNSSDTGALIDHAAQLQRDVTRLSREVAILAVCVAALAGVLLAYRLGSPHA